MLPALCLRSVGSAQGEGLHRPRYHSQVLQLQHRPHRGTLTCECHRSSEPSLAQHLFDASNYKLTRSKSGESRLFLHYGDLADTSNLVDVIRRVQPDEIYNLAAQSHVQVPPHMHECAPLGYSTRFIPAHGEETRVFVR